jgi:hypothetical protein
MNSRGLRVSKVSLVKAFNFAEYRGAFLAAACARSRRAWDKCLAVVTSVWAIEWTEVVRSQRDEAQAEIIQRQAG